MASSAVALTARLPEDDWNKLHHLSCWRDTGGTCWVRDCDTFRVSNCNKSLGYKCLCESSKCAGSDGVCHSQGNTEVARGFSLVNAMFPDYRLYVPYSGNCGNQLILMATSELPENNGRTDASHLHSSLFRLLQLPDPDPGDAFLLAPMANPDAGCVVNPNAGFFAVKDEATESGPDGPAIRFQRAPGRARAVMIESVQSPGNYLYAPGWFKCSEGTWNPTCGSWTLGFGWGHIRRDTFWKGSWFRAFGSIETMVGDPGESGYWFIYPPIPGLLTA